MRPTSLAAVAYESRKLMIQEFPLPEIGDDDGLLQVEAVGISGSDWSRYIGLHGVKFPIILGYEIVGRIARIGKSAAKRWGVSEGDRVVVEEPFPCGRCWICQNVNYQLCRNGGRYGSVSTTITPALWGGFSEYMYLHKNSIIYKVNSSLPPRLAPLFIPLANGIRWVRQIGKVSLGDVVVIQGPGQHGLGCVIAAREAGASCIIVTGLSKDKSRLELAKALGASVTVNVEEEDLKERVAQITDGMMADLVVDVTANSPEAVTQAINIVRIGGTIVLAGVKHKPLYQFNIDDVSRKEITVRGVYGRDYKAVIPALKLLQSGKYPFELFSTHSFPLTETEQALKVFAGEEHTARDPIHVSVVI